MRLERFWGPALPQKLADYGSWGVTIVLFLLTAIADANAVQLGKDVINDMMSYRPPSTQERLFYREISKDFSDHATKTLTVPQSVPLATAPLPLFKSLLEIDRKNFCSSFASKGQGVSLSKKKVAHLYPL